MIKTENGGVEMILKIIWLVIGGIIGWLAIEFVVNYRKARYFEKENFGDW